MVEQGGRHTGGEGEDLFDLWLAHRDTEGTSRSSTEPPRWAPKVTAPPEPEPASETPVEHVPEHVAEPPRGAHAAVVEPPVVDEAPAEELAIDEPVAAEPVVESPVAEQPVIEEPVAEQPVIEEPVAEQPVIEEPVAEQPVIEEPVAEQPVIDEPAVEVPVAEVPVEAEPAIEEPAIEEPVAEEPAIEEPAIEEPVAEEPVAEAPAAVPLRQRVAAIAEPVQPPEPPEPDVPSDLAEPEQQEPVTTLIDLPAANEAANEAADEADEAVEPAATGPVVTGPVVTGPVDDSPAPIRHTFRPRTRARTAVAIGTLLAAGASVIGCYIAARERDLPSVGIAVTLWILTGIIWAVYSGTSVTRLSVRGGQLQIIRQGVRTTFDLTSSYTPVEVHGRPGKHGWKVVFVRRDMSAFVIDPSMVDPSEFMRVLRYYRPGIDAEPAKTA